MENLHFNVIHCIFGVIKHNTMKYNKTQAIVLRVDIDLKLELIKLAEADSRNLSDYIRLQLKKLVDSVKKQ
jgi:hypothetical protein